MPQEPAAGRRHQPHEAGRRLPTAAAAGIKLRGAKTQNGAKRGALLADNTPRCTTRESGGLVVKTGDWWLKNDVEARGQGRPGNIPDLKCNDLK